MNNLSESSKSYTHEANIYQKFSDAEDWPQFIHHHVIPNFSGLNVLDVGCGNGKYCKVLSPFVKSITGLDKAFEQLENAKRNTDGFAKFIQADCTLIPLADSSQDAILACWVLGTLDTNERRIQAIAEMRRVLTPNGKIILIENDGGCEFELLRGRTMDTRTKDYNSWLETQGFKITNRFTTYFHFNSTYDAQNVFKAIWDTRLTQKITSNTLNHKVAIFEYQKN